MSSTSLTDLAHTLLKNASELEAYFNATNQPAPTFNEHYPPELPLSEDMQSVRSLIVDTCLELHDLVVGPAMLLRPTVRKISYHAYVEIGTESFNSLMGLLCNSSTSMTLPRKFRLTGKHPSFPLRSRAILKKPTFAA